MSRSLRIRVRKSRVRCAHNAVEQARAATRIVRRQFLGESFARNYVFKTGHTHLNKHRETELELRHYPNDVTHAVYCFFYYNQAY